MVNALNFSLQYNGDIEPEFIETIHDKCVENTLRETGNCFVTGFNDGSDVRFAISAMLTEDGLSELDEKMAAGKFSDTNYCLKTTDPEGNPCRVIFGGADRITIINKVKSFIHEFKQNMALFSSPEAKLKELLRLVQNLNHGHFFVDGNIRSLVFILLNTALLREGEPPIIWCNPNKIDGHSLLESVELAKEGQERFLRLRLPRLNSPDLQGD